MLASQAHEQAHIGTYNTLIKRLGAMNNLLSAVIARPAGFYFLLDARKTSEVLKSSKQDNKLWGGKEPATLLVKYDVINQRVEARFLGNIAIDVRCLQTDWGMNDRTEHLIEVLISGNIPMDEAQHQVFLKPTFEITCGVNPIQGPPGTGKPRTFVVIILLLIELDLKVLLIAGSNKGINNSAEAVAAALNKHTRLQSGLRPRDEIMEDRTISPALPAMMPYHFYYMVKPWWVELWDGYPNKAKDKEQGKGMGDIEDRILSGILSGEAHGMLKYSTAQHKKDDWNAADHLARCNYNVENINIRSHKGVFLGKDWGGLHHDNRALDGPMTAAERELLCTYMMGMDEFESKLILHEPDDTSATELITLAADEAETEPERTAEAEVDDVKRRMSLSADAPPYKTACEELALDPLSPVLLVPSNMMQAGTTLKKWLVTGAFLCPSALVDTWLTELTARLGDAFKIMLFHGHSAHTSNYARKLLTRKLLRALRLDTSDLSTAIYTDSDNAFDMVHKNRFPPSIRWLANRYLFAKDAVQQGLVYLILIDGNDNPADGLTKPLSVSDFEQFRNMLHMTKVDAIEDDATEIV
ncbi:hypothetical protein CNMCM5623_003756 [Aspergillus felis]|uniref:DNA2/NAM7 helicase helicase domain-containing protein n=1 Tax=Aspergillus felis TaxID=1287682 RepID=A0A8H6QCW5_9EURO|nr:hypothetical protein CNMCM5623_003756 [Aspergillus felis]